MGEVRNFVLAWNLNFIKKKERKITFLFQVKKVTNRFNGEQCDRYFEGRAFLSSKKSEIFVLFIIWLTDKQVIPMKTGMTGAIDKTSINGGGLLPPFDSIISEPSILFLRYGRIWHIQIFVFQNCLFFINFSVYFRVNITILCWF